jgi:hypothetical protein
MEEKIAGRMGREDGMEGNEGGWRRVEEGKLRVVLPAIILQFLRSFLSLPLPFSVFRGSQPDTKIGEEGQRKAERT